MAFAVSRELQLRLGYGEGETQRVKCWQGTGIKGKKEEKGRLT